MWSAPRSRSKRRHSHSSQDRSVPGWARFVILAALVAVVGTLAWRGVQERAHPSRRSRAYDSAPGIPAPAANRSANSARNLAPNSVPNSLIAGAGNVSATWQRETAASFDAALREATAGNLTAAQMAVDRGAAIVTASRVQKQSAAPDYFETSIAQLDRVVKAHPGNERLDEHVNLARIEIAQLRSALEAPSANATPALAATSDANPAANFAVGSAANSSAAGGADNSGKAGALKGAATNPSVGANAAANSAANSSGSAANTGDANRVSIGAPQSVATGSLVDPTLMGGSFIDATLMPHTSELLEPPSSRTFADKVRVENLTFAGATQTLDGLRFKNVTFIGTRLRFEGGQVELQNVHFINCTFGFTTDARGARLANAVALGHTSLLIE
jgi:hypothetical protein